MDFKRNVKLLKGLKYNSNNNKTMNSLFKIKNNKNKKSNYKNNKKETIVNHNLKIC